MKGLRAESLGAARPTVTERYLRSFTDESFPSRTRRWVGLVLHRLIRTSPDVVDHLASHLDIFAEIGQIVLTQPEDLKLVAGMIIREMVLAGIQHARFWPTDAIPSAIPDFPTNDSQHWIEKFQDFLDDLHGLRFIGNNGGEDPGILYAFEITADDGVHIIEETGLIVLLVEGDHLTCFVPPSSTRIAQCFDIPLAHVTHAEVSKSTVRTFRESQMELTTAELILHLEAESWTYLCNAKEYHVQKIVILCRNLVDAQEAALMVLEEKEAADLPTSNSLGPKISASQIIDISKPLGPRDNIKESMDVQSTNEHFIEKPTTEQTKPKESASAQHLETQFSGNQAADPRLNSLETKKTTQSLVRKEPQHPQKGEAPTSGTLPQVKKLRQLASGSKSALDDPTNEKDNFEVPLSPEKPHKNALKKLTPSEATKDVIATNDTEGSNTPKHITTSQNQINQTNQKPMRPMKVGVKLNFRSLRRVEDTDTSGPDSSQLPSQQIVKEKGAKKNIPQETPHIMQRGSSRDRTKEDQKFLKSRVGNKPAKIPKGKASSGHDSNENSVFDIPPDGPQEPRKHGKRPIVQHIQSEPRESTTESDESEYIEPKRKPKPPAKNPSVKKAKTTLKPKVSGNSKLRNKKKQARVQKAITPPSPPIPRPSILNKLLTGTGSRRELEQQKPRYSRETSEAGDVQNYGIELQSNPTLELPSLLSHSKITRTSSILKRPTEVLHPSTPEPKRSKVAQIVQHTNEDVVEGNMDSMTRSIVDFANKPGSMRVHETGSPCPIAKFVAEKPSTKQMIEKLLDSMPAEEEVDEYGDSGHLTHSEEVALHSKDLLCSNAKESETILVDVQSSNSKALPASPAAASRAISGHVTNIVVEKAKADAEKVKAVNDPFKHLSKELPPRPRTAFAQLLAGQAEQRTQEDHNQMQRSQDTLPPPATSAHRQQTNANGDLDETLVGIEDEGYFPAKASPITEISSLRLSSHSSSSATQVFEEIDTELAEEIEWEASLQPHQRVVADMLTRISRRLVRHLVDSETALRDIIADYERDGYALIAKLGVEHPLDHAACLERIEAQRTAMAKEFREAAKRLEQARAGL
ncbi:hypothetical protein AOQ84DRAFT_423229 [Glonium stellatum]|uniref:Uncharacterized protein n=1 Tax=Glonium stellatum TaxID=574774 RepID=A0A8E2F786_9PEZI|nr:hypothetical protein AOQ84DRAFT_423229 [Glonium stellatum]